jgi:hypothetical protein
MYFTHDKSTVVCLYKYIKLVRWGLYWLLNVLMWQDLRSSLANHLIKCIQKRLTFVVMSLCAQITLGKFSCKWTAPACFVICSNSKCNNSGKKIALQRRSLLHGPSITTKAWSTMILGRCSNWERVKTRRLQIVSLRSPCLYATSRVHGSHYPARKTISSNFILLWFYYACPSLQCICGLFTNISGCLMELHWLSVNLKFLVYLSKYFMV